MPYREDLDVTRYLDALGDQTHGLRSAVIKVAGVDASRPYKAGDGPVACSTSTELVPGPGVIWDTNGYYGLFGIEFPYRPVTKAELRRRALELFAREGQSTLATYALSLLMSDSPERRDYHYTALGDQYLDVFTQEKLKAMAAMVASDLCAQGDTVTAREVLQSWGLELTEQPLQTSDPDAATLPDEPDPEPDPQPEDEADDVTLSEVSATQTWDWSFYVQTAPRIDLDQLRAWQESLVSALNAYYPGMLEGFAVGVVGGQGEQFRVDVIDGEIVFLIDDQTWPTEHMAFLAMTAVEDGMLRLRAAQRGTDEMENHDRRHS